MKVEQTSVTKLIITGVPDLDPVAVYLEDMGPERGKITIACFNDCWSYFWGSMGRGYDIRKFFCMADEEYLAGKLHPRLKSTVDDFEKLEQHAKEYIRQQRREGWLSKNEARELYEDCEHLETMPHEDPTQYAELMYRIFGDGWWYDVPKMPNHEYEYLCRIIKTVKEVIGNQHQKLAA